MKKFVCLLLAAVMALSMMSVSAFADTQSFKIAIVQQLDHPSLDEIRTACDARLKELAQEKGFSVEVKDFHGQNDQTVLNQIGAQVVDDDYDAIIPIATLAALCMATATEDNQIPVIYAAISDPESSGLTDIANVTGPENYSYLYFPIAQEMGLKDRKQFQAYPAH